MQLGHESVDRLHVFLGMRVFPDMDATFAKLWSLLSPGGRCVIVDVHAERLDLPHNPKHGGQIKLACGDKPR